jgi:hypothetical protein
VASLQNNLALHAMAHLTCLGTRRWISPRSSTGWPPKTCRHHGLARRPAAGREQLPPASVRISHASDLIGFIRDGWPQFKIGCAAYPEGHPDPLRRASRARRRATSPSSKQAGERRGFAVTQLFFDNAVYHDFIAQARARVSRSRCCPASCRSARLGRSNVCGALRLFDPGLLRQAAAAEDVEEAGFPLRARAVPRPAARGAPGIISTRSTSRSPPAASSPRCARKFPACEKLCASRARDVVILKKRLGNRISCMRIVFMGSSDASAVTLRALLRAPQVNVVGVVTQPDRPSGRRQRFTPCPCKACGRETRLPDHLAGEVNAPRSGAA